MTLPASKIGDKEQRFVVQGRRQGRTDWENVAYSNDEEGAAKFEEATRMWPRYVEARTIDRDKGGPR